MDFNANKIDARLNLKLAQLKDPALKIACFVKVDSGLTDEQKAELKQMDLNHIAGEIYTARLSGDDIKSLSNKDFVVSIQGSALLSPC